MARASMPRRSRTDGPKRGNDRLHGVRRVGSSRRRCQGSLRGERCGHSTANRIATRIEATIDDTDSVPGSVNDGIDAASVSLSARDSAVMSTWTGALAIAATVARQRARDINRRVLG